MSNETLKPMMIENNMDDYGPMDGYRKRDIYNMSTIKGLASHYTEILKLIGEDPSREGLEKTPLSPAATSGAQKHTPPAPRTAASPARATFPRQPLCPDKC